MDTNKSIATECAPELSWAASDIEQRLGFRGGRFTRVNSLLTFILAIAVSVAFYAILILTIRQTPFAAMFLDRGFTPYVMTVLFAWSGIIMVFKWRKLKLQSKSLLMQITPSEPDFVLSTTTVGSVLTRMFDLVDDPKAFVLFNRVHVALSNLKNLGRVGDVDEMLQSQAEMDQSGMETSYSLIRGFIWAIPVLGFIGTVMGLSQAVGGFGEVLGKNASPDQLASSLRLVTSGLATAFETTLVALLFALFLQLVATFLQKNEEEFLDLCAEYCQRHIVSKLRLMPFESEP